MVQRTRVFFISKKDIRSLVLCIFIHARTRGYMCVSAYKECIIYHVKHGIKNFVRNVCQYLSYRKACIWTAKLILMETFFLPFLWLLIFCLDLFVVSTLFLRVDDKLIRREMKNYAMVNWSCYTILRIFQ